MHCTEFHHRLDAVLDDRRNPAVDRELAAHAAICNSCRKLLADSHALLVGVSQQRVPKVSAIFSRRVVAAAVADMPRPSVKSRWQTGPVIVAVLASAAAMLLAVSLTWLSQNVDPAARGKDVLWTSFRGFGITTPPFERKAPQKVGGNLTIADVLLQTPRLPRRFGAYRSQIDLAVALPAAAQRLDELEQLSPSLRSLRASLDMIWGTLLLRLPASSSEPSETRRDGIGSVLSRFQPAFAC